MSSCLSDEPVLDNLQNHIYGSQQRAENVKKSNKLKLRECEPILGESKLTAAAALCGAKGMGKGRKITVDVC